MAKRMSWYAFLKIFVVSKRPIPYGLCAYEHVAKIVEKLTENIFCS